MKLIHKSPIFDLVEIKHNNKPFVQIRSLDWVNIIAINSNQEVLLIEQYRLGTESYTWETPGGIIDSGEEALEAAKRELKEETGFESNSWESLGWIHANLAYQNNRCHFFL